MVVLNKLMETFINMLIYYLITLNNETNFLKKINSVNYFKKTVCYIPFLDMYLLEGTTKFSAFADVINLLFIR